MSGMEAHTVSEGWMSLCSKKSEREKMKHHFFGWDLGQSSA